MGGIDDPQTFNNYMFGDPSHPIVTNVDGGLDMTILGDPSHPVTSLMTGDPTKPIATLILGDPTKPVAALLEGDPSKPITTNSTIHMGLDDIRIKELPHIHLSAELGIKPTRIHNPVDMKLCISFFGFEVLSFAMCGESMTIIEPYHPHKTEECI
jgi:hypothetical protein